VHAAGREKIECGLDKLLPALGCGKSYCHRRYLRVTTDAGVSSPPCTTVPSFTCTALSNNPRDIVAFAQAANSADLCVLHRGEPLIDESWGPRVDVASVQKSIVSVLVGIAVARGDVALDDRVSAHLGAGWTGRDDVATEGDVTVSHLLTMTSGLGDAFETVAKPGDRWDYNLVVYPTAKRVLRAATSRALEDITREWVTGPLGMTETTWEPRVWNDQLPAIFKGAFVYPDGSPMEALVAPARDLAKFGQAVMAGCVGLGVDETYGRAMTRPSQALNPAYGLLWWVNDSPLFFAPRAAAPVDGPFFPGLPADTYAALGAGDQCCVVVPSLDLVVARTGGAAGEASAAGSGFVRALARSAVALVSTE
jgi:CubicO group peptidase (beta-lactamase class C family)